MGYRNDQYFGLVNAGERGANIYGGTALSPSLNKPFIYPDRTVRTNSVLNAGGLSVEPTLQRGYIRSIANSLGGVSLTQAKCNFQFNPRILNHSVNQNTKILDFLHQDPSQYAQPIPGNVSFSFMLFFDRSMELNKGGPDTSGYDTSSDNPWERFGPETVGVLHDISALYSVIGQGIGAQQKAYIQSVLENQIKGEINAANADATVEVDEDGNQTVIGTAYGETEQAEYAGAANEFINELGNFGNVAFLLPLPVRVVFSSLYIVEGLVQNASTKFTKFNSAMVPMQATVELTMEAKYIGFAKKNTFFTEVLAKREESELVAAEVVERQAAQVNTNNRAASDSLDVVRVFLGAKEGNYRVTIESSISQQRTLNFDDLAEELDRTMVVSFPNEEDNQSIRDLYDTGSVVNCSVTGSLHVWRYTDVFVSNNTELFGTGDKSDLTDAQKEQLIEALEEWSLRDASEFGNSSIPDYDGTNRPYRTALKVRSHTLTSSGTNAVATSKSQFEKQAEKCYSEPETGVKDRSVDGDERGADDSEFWFAVDIRVNISLSVDSAETSQSARKIIFYNSKGGGHADTNIELNWPDAGYNAEEGVVI